MLKSKLFKTLSTVVPGLFIVIVGLLFLAVTFRGDKKLNYFDKTFSTRVGGPFESSNNNARYALVKSIVDRGTFFFTKDQANFSAPDVVSYKGKYFSVFTPGISFLAIPFYTLGKFLGYEQATTYLLTTLFTLLDLFLIALLTKKISGNWLAGSISTFTFLLATNALAFSGTLTQHLITTFLLLFAVYNSIYIESWLAYIIAGGLFGLGLLVDIPNIFILMPTMFLIIGRIFRFVKKRNFIDFHFDIKGALFILAFIPFIALFGYYNLVTAGSPLKLAQFIGRTENVQQEVQTYTINAPDNKDTDTVSIDLPFNTRRLLNGFYILLVSDERGLIYYYPILLFGVIGLIFTLRNENTKKISLISIATISAVILTYAMFGDPWGGWSFGARYMIPANALLSIFVGYVFAKLYKNFFFAIVFTPILIYSLYINTIGAVTTATVPPKGEAENLTVPVPYTYEYNLTYLNKNLSSSYLYNSYFIDKMPLSKYFIYIVVLEISVFAGLYIAYLFRMKGAKNEI